MASMVGPQCELRIAGKCCRLLRIAGCVFQCKLTHSFPMHPFSTPWKQQKTVRFSDIFRGQRKGALGANGLRYLSRAACNNQTWKLKMFFEREKLNVNNENYLVKTIGLKLYCCNLWFRHHCRNQLDLAG